MDVKYILDFILNERNIYLENIYNKLFVRIHIFIRT